MLPADPNIVAGTAHLVERWTAAEVYPLMELHKSALATGSPFPSADVLYSTRSASFQLQYEPRWLEAVESAQWSSSNRYLLFRPSVFRDQSDPFCLKAAGSLLVPQNPFAIQGMVFVHVAESSQAPDFENRLRQALANVPPRPFNASASLNPPLHLILRLPWQNRGAPMVRQCIKVVMESIAAFVASKPLEKGQIKVRADQCCYSVMDDDIIGFIPDKNLNSGGGFLRANHSQCPIRFAREAVSKSLPRRLSRVPFGSCCSSVTQLARRNL